MANKKYEMVITLSKDEFDAIEACRPNHKRGNDEGSFNACKKACGYAFEALNHGKAFNRSAYDRGCFLFMEKYTSLLSDASFPADAPKAEDEKPSTGRGKNKKNDGLDIDSMTKAEKEALLKKLLGL